MRNEKGITLIALILAILVLLVLAGISVSLMLSNENEGNVVKNNNINNSKFTDREIYQEDEGIDLNVTLPPATIENDVENSASDINPATLPVNEATELENAVDNSEATTGTGTNQVVNTVR